MKWRSLRAWIEDIGGDERDYLRARRSFHASGRVAYPAWHPRRDEDVATYQAGPREMIRVGQHSSEDAPSAEQDVDGLLGCVLDRIEPERLARLVVERADVDVLARGLEARGWRFAARPHGHGEWPNQTNKQTPNQGG